MIEYPEAIEVRGVEYEINTDFRHALACFRCIMDSEISGMERAYGVLNLLYKEIPEDENEALRLAIKYLRCGKEPSKEPDEPPDMDFEVDAQVIEASFMSDYKIDLDDVNMHWWKFCALLQGLSDKCALNRVRDLRNYNPETIKDPKERQKMRSAQNRVALPNQLDASSQDIVDEFERALAEGSQA